ncbi:MAG: glycosyltransferase family 4 protein [Bryobacteraceae bacterium]
MSAILCSILGAREHYAPAVMAHRAGCLHRLVTDFWAPSVFRSVPKALHNATLRRMADRHHAQLPPEKVCALTRLGMEYRWRLSRAHNRAQQYAVYEEMGTRFAAAASAYLTSGQDAFFGYSNASLETIHAANRLGLWTVVDQIDPAKTEFDLVTEEHKRFPALAPPMSEPPESYFRRIRSEWDASDAIVVNSDWSRVALIEQGVEPEKLHVVPLAYEPTSEAEPRSEMRNVLKILWVGTMCLRKGLPYALAAAARLTKAPVQFTFAGPLEVNSAALNLPSNCEYVGAVPRSETVRLYQQHDVFLFPTLSDGFGLTQLEAMSYGLPVIATPCCASVVENGESGFVIEPRDPDAIVTAIERFLSDASLLPAMSAAALRRSRDFSTAAVWSVLSTAFHRQPVLTN